MHLPFLGSFVLALTLDLIPALVILTRIRARARAAGVPAGPHAVVAVVGGLLAGMAGNSAVAVYFLHRAQTGVPAPFRSFTGLAIGGGMGASALVAAVAYLHFRMVT